MLVYPRMVATSFPQKRGRAVFCRDGANVGVLVGEVDDLVHWGSFLSFPSDTSRNSL